MFNKNTDIEKFLPLIKSVIKKYQGMGIPEEDLIQEGYIAVIEASKKFNPDKNTKFTSYAVFWIKKRILSIIDKEYKETEHLIIKENIPEIIPDKKNEYTMKSTKITFPENFPKNEKTVLKLLFEEEFTLKEIAEKLQMSREKTRQIKMKALRRLKAISLANENE